MKQNIKFLLNKSENEGLKHYINLGFLLNT